MREFFVLQKAIPFGKSCWWVLVALPWAHNSSTRRWACRKTEWHFIVWTIPTLMEWTSSSLISVPHLSETLVLVDFQIRGKPLKLAMDAGGRSGFPESGVGICRTCRRHHGFRQRPGRKKRWQKGGSIFFRCGSGWAEEPPCFRSWITARLPGRNRDRWLADGGRQYGPDYPANRDSTKPLRAAGIDVVSRG